MWHILMILNKIYENSLDGWAKLENSKGNNGQSDISSWPPLVDKSVLFYLHPARTHASTAACTSQMKRPAHTHTQTY